MEPAGYRRERLPVPLDLVVVDVAAMEPAGYQRERRCLNPASTCPGVHHLRAEIAADIGPTLERMQNQLDLIESAVDIALTKWYAKLRYYPPRPPDILPPS